MQKHTAAFAVTVILALVVVALGVSAKPASLTGSWQVDSRHSDAKLTTDATTDYGKTKTIATLGFARVNGKMTIEDDPAKSSVDLRFYPATAMSPSIDEDGKFQSHWLENLSNHTLVCFHSKQVVRTPDGKLKATGNMTLTRVDRNVEATPDEAYAGPVYGPPVIHRVSREATFVFDLPGANAKGQKDGGIEASGSSKVFREDFPQLVKAVVNTYWPMLVQEKNCRTPSASEAYSGTQCTGTFLDAPGLPEAPHAANAEDLPGAQNFNDIVGEQLTILLQMRLTPKGSGEPAAGGN